MAQVIQDSEDGPPGADSIGVALLFEPSAFCFPDAGLWSYPDKNRDDRKLGIKVVRKPGAPAGAPMSAADIHANARALRISDVAIEAV